MISDSVSDTHSTLVFITSAAYLMLLNFQCLHFYHLECGDYVENSPTFEMRQLISF